MEIKRKINDGDISYEEVILDGGCYNEYKFSYGEDEIAKYVVEGEKIEEKNQRLPLTANSHDVPWEVRRAGVEDSMGYSEWSRIENKNIINWTREQYSKIGIEVIEEYDDLFFNVILPKGWRIEETTHSMWNNVFDEKGRKRMEFFCKKSFYDRDAFTNFERRYSYSKVPFDEYKTNASYEERRDKEWHGVIYDSNTEIFRTEPMLMEDVSEDTIKNICIEYLNKNYPLWEEINAYWND